MTKSSQGEKSFNCQLLVCNCQASMNINAKKLAAHLKLDEEPEIHTHLCRSQVDKFEAAVAENTMADNKGEKLIVACTQEAPLFDELAADHGEVDIEFVNIRETAGWSKAGAKANAKMAALIAGASFEPTPTGLLPVESDGTCIVYGAGQQAYDVAQKLSSRLNVSLVLSDASDVFMSGATTFPIYRGTITNMSGSIGQFSVMVDGYAGVEASSRDQLGFHDGENGVELATALVFDLSGNTPLLGARHGRDGYIHVDPKNPTQIANEMFDISDLVGEFEKPLYVSYDPSICAHSRNGQVGCSNCIDNCPTSAISSSGDGIKVATNICDGCGHCSSSCPTGAIAYAYPNRADLVSQCQIMLSTYLHAGGKNPILLVHEHDHGDKLISAMARFGDGLAENVIPMAVQSVAHLGHDALSAFFTSGVQSVAILTSQKNLAELAALEFQIELTNGFLRAMGFEEAVQVQLICEDDPDIVADVLNAIPKVKMPKPQNISASKNKRETARLALSNLNAMAPASLDILDLPENAPYGQIMINTESCTLCLSCVGACPAGALGDNENRPQVSFTEHSCVQCGLCRTTCPENSISLKPCYNFDKSALSPVVLNEEEPFECTKCGKPFGSKSAIDKVIGILAGNNPMFQTSDQLALLKMCENCRVITMAETDKDPMTLGTVPRTLTAADITEDDDEPTRH